MKKKLLLALVLSLALGIAGTANAAVFYTDWESVGTTVTGTGTIDWSHDVTTDLTVPYDTINWAYLSIVGKAWGGNNDGVTISNSFYLGALGPGFELFGITVNVFGVDQVFSGGWGPGSTFDVSLAYNELGEGNYLKIISSNLTLSYNNNTAPVPEPGTMLLLGSGLVGLAGWGRKKFRK